jgi:uncharacterized membrane protein (UPF0127 family)
MLPYAVATLALSVLLVAIATFSPPSSAIVSAGGYYYPVLLATNLQQWKHGLMNYTFSCSTPGMCINGMIFIFPSSASECFWMKDTPQPLTQIWIANGKVTEIYQATPESTTSVCAYGNQVLELNSNLPYNLSVGSTVSTQSS